MSGCGVCLYSGDGTSIGYRCKIVKAGQNWKCSECDCEIKKGAKYELTSGFNAEDGNQHWQTKTCLICAEIAEAFYCDGRYHGRLWAAMEDAFERFNSSCFDKLKTVEAKTELRRRWMAWKGLA